MVTFPQASIGSGYIDLNVASGQVTLSSLTATRSGAPAQIDASSFVSTVSGGTTGYGVFDYYLYRNGSLVSGFNNSRVQGQNAFTATIFYSDTQSSTTTYLLKAQVTSVVGGLTNVRFLIPSITFVELKR